MEASLPDLCHDPIRVAATDTVAEIRPRLASDPTVSSVLVDIATTATLIPRRLLETADEARTAADLIDPDVVVLEASATLAVAARSLMARADDARFDDVAVRNGDTVRALRVETLLLELADRRERRSTIDPLTGLPSRAAFRQHLGALLDDAEAGVDVVFVDLDRFKLINDTLGHAAGDEALRLTADRLRAAVRIHDVVCRVGGDEFLVLIPGGIGERALDELLTRIRHRLAEPADIGGITTVLSASIGVATGTAGDDPDELVHRADVAMYEAKRQGGSVWIRSDGTPLPLLGVDELQLEHDFRVALDRGDIHAEFQPIVDLDTGRVVSFEALARWTDPTRGVIGPDRFLPLAHTIGQLDRIDDIVMADALRFARRLPESCRIAVNRCVRSLTCPDAVDRLEALRSGSGVAADRIEIEVSELVVVAELDRLRATLAELRHLGYQIALDDFGSGQTSLLHLASLPLTSIKIDRGLVIHPDADDVVGPVTEIARSRGIPVVAEGIEDEATARRMAELGCARAQGFHYARPARPATFDDRGWQLDRPITLPG